MARKYEDRSTNAGHKTIWYQTVKLVKLLYNTDDETTRNR